MFFALQRLIQRQNIPHSESGIISLVTISSVLYDEQPYVLHMTQAT